MPHFRKPEKPWPRGKTLYVCHDCRRPVEKANAVQYDGFLLCPACAAERAD